MTETAPADHRYIQVARALRKDIVDGVYPVGSQLPTEHELCERFSVSRYTVREALRRLREDNLVSSRPRAGTLVVPRSRRTPTTSCRSTIWWHSRPRPDSPSSPSTWSHSTTTSPPGPGLGSGEEWLAVRGFRQAEAADFPLCRTEYYINRAFAAIGRLLQRHTGPIFPLIEDLFGVSIVEVHQEIAAVVIPPRARRRPQDRAGHARAGSAAHVQDVRRRGRTGHGEHASRIAVSPFDDHAAGQRLVDMPTLADSILEAATR